MRQLLRDDLALKAKCEELEHFKTNGVCVEQSKKEALI